MLTLRGENARDVAKCLYEDLSGPKKPKLHLRPYNRFDLTGENTWWISATTDNPTYAVGKFFCSNHEDHCEAGQIRCGLYVEKGVEEGAEDPSLKMLAHWEWHRFVAALTSGAFANAVDAAAKATGQPIQIQMVGKIGDCKEEFSADMLDGTLIDVTMALSPSVGAFRHLRGCKTLTGLGTQLSGDVRKALSWGWIDVYVSGVFKLASTGSDDIVRCVQMLYQFEPWVFCR